MQIALTKKLAELLPAHTLADSEDCPPLFQWSANVLTFNRRKVVVAVCDGNRFSVVLYGLKAKDFKVLPQLICSAIHLAFKQYGISEEVFELYKADASDVHCVKLQNRSAIARMNKAVERFSYFDGEVCTDSLYQKSASLWLNSELVKSGEKDYSYCYENLFSDLSTHYELPIFQNDAYDLIVSLDLERSILWRRLLVPTSYSFEQLHNAIQCALDWDGDHLYEFHLAGPKEVLHLCCCDDCADEYEPENAALACDVKLSQLLKSGDSFNYSYDFGDDWELKIEVKAILKDYNSYHAACLMGVGIAPCPGFLERKLDLQYINAKLEFTAFSLKNRDY